MPRLVPAPRRDALEQRDGERPAPRSIPEVHEQTRSLRPAPQRSSGPTRMDAVLSGASSGMLESFPLIGGVAGAVLTGGSPIGLGLGIAAGELVKRAYRATMDVPTVDEMPPELRPFFVGGEILGGSLAPGMAPFAAGRARTGVRFVDRIIESAQQRPVAFAAAEASAAIGSAAGAGLSSRIFDGNPWAELAGGVVGGAFSPGSTSFTVTGLLSDAYSRTRSMLSTAGQTNRAAAELHALLAETGEDPAALAKALREPDVEGARRTAAQLTGSPALQLLEAELARRSPQFGREAASRAQESLEAMRLLIGRLAATGDPQALREAARLRERYFETLIQGRLAAAEKQAQEAAARIADDTPGARAELGRQLERILSNALVQVRAAERQLWQQIPRNTPVQPTKLLSEAVRIATEDLLPTERLPRIAEAYLRRLGFQRGKTPGDKLRVRSGTSAATVGELLIFRSRMLDEARSAAANGDYAGARVLGRLAEAALDDLSDVPGTDEARAFSRALHDNFTRSFVGDVLATDSTGAARIPPEVLVKRATAGPAEVVNLRLEEIERAVRMGSPEAADELLNVQRRVLRLAASEIVDPNTGQASGPRLGRFLRANEAWLNRFPEIREILRNVESANALLRATRESTDQAARAIRRDAAFARIAGAENPVRAVGGILTGPAPVQQYGQLARLAHAQGDDAVEGLRSATLRYAFDRAGGAEGVFSFTSFRKALMEPPRPGQPSALDLMRRTDVIDADTASRLSRLLDEADRVESALRTQPQLQGLLAQDNLMLDFVLRIIGSRAASATSAVTGTAGGHSIIIAGAGSRFARHVMDKIPAGRVQEVLIQAAEEPQLMATLLERATTEQRKFELSRKLNAWLVALGLVHDETVAEAAMEAGQGQPFQQGFVGQP